MELDYDESIRQSRLLYSKIYPEDEFLPKAPEPEEIVIGDEDGSDGNVNLGVLADLIEENKIDEAQPEEAMESLKINNEENQESELS